MAINTIFSKNFNGCILNTDSHKEIKMMEGKYSFAPFNQMRQPGVILNALHLIFHN